MESIPGRLVSVPEVPSSISPPPSPSVGDGLPATVV
ncbi:uncharacterized protein G2W53_009522 [Senna tora]|uniref:Uncharacterized protein n=1 Tax=Senna tora TaxID=362788 RepID=A0A834WYK1_9FABA|nr:uncharacterized protein G2W53_009522 [Senna tora]